MQMLASSMAKLRCEDKLALRRQNRFANTGGTTNGGGHTFGLGSEGRSGQRPPSSGATYNSCGMPM